MYIENHILKSKDSCDNWVEEKLYKPAYTSPISFYEVDGNGLKTWIYSGSGVIQVLK
jgi:hypothetical protein